MSAKGPVITSYLQLFTMFTYKINILWHRLITKHIYNAKNTLYYTHYACAISICLQETTSINGEYSTDNLLCIFTS